MNRKVDQGGCDTDYGCNGNGCTCGHGLQGQAH